MYILHWVFINDHKWSKEFDTENDALDFMHKCGFLLSYAIDKVWLSMPNNEELWLKEKSGA